MNKYKSLVSHHLAEVEELRADRELAVEYMKLAIELLNDSEYRAAGLRALGAIVEAYGGFSADSEEADISRESLYRSLSPDGNPTLKTLLAVLKTLKLRLSVAPEEHHS